MDGHGSTRLLTNSSGSITDRYSFDAYGVLLSPPTSVLSPPATSLLYSGEQFDVNLQMQYLRARYYDQNTGRFGGLDPFSGDSEDPQSLHKYLYTHNDPVNGIDPNGEVEFTLIGQSVTNAINFTITTFKLAGVSAVAGAAFGGAVGGFLHTLQNRSLDGVTDAMVDGSVMGAIYGAVVGLSSVSLTLLAVTLSSLFGINAYLTLPLLRDNSIKPEVKAAIVALLVFQAIATVKITTSIINPTVIPENAGASIPNSALSNFTNGKASETTIPETSVLFRISNKGSEGGNWWFRVPVKSIAEFRSRFAVLPEWNTADSFTILRVPKGASLKGWKGDAAAQEPRHLYPGGSEQYYVPKAPGEWLETYKFSELLKIKPK